jgi:hypothetical protein
MLPPTLLTMAPAFPKPIESDTSPWLDVKPAPNVWVSLAAIPLLTALLTSKALAETVQTVGLWSEEIFRGDRLPILDLSASTDLTVEESESS